MSTIYQPPTEHKNLEFDDAGLLAAVARGEARLTLQQGLDTLKSLPMAELGRWADARCRAIHGDSLRTYVIDRNINYTNICTAKCIFCAFKRTADDHDSYTLEYEQLYEKIAELDAIGGTQILMQGGMNPELGLDWYLNLLRGIKERFPHIHVHGFSPPEFIEFVNFFTPPGKDLEAKLRWVMVRLQEAGLDSLPGGGGEIFAPAVREKIGMGKCDAEAWLTTMYVAHSLGMYTSATMMFGHIEGLADRVHHLGLVRKWQDKALMDFGTGNVPGDVAGDPSVAKPATGGHYTAFISWPFQSDNTALGRVKEWPQPGDDGVFPGDAAANLEGTGTKNDHPDFGRRLRLAGATPYLRAQATSRLLLDNIYSIGASWVTMGPHVGQMGLKFGANDMGSVMMEENVVSSAGTTYCLDEAVLCRLIRDAGFMPAQRDNSYDVLRVQDGQESPDLQVSDWSKHRTQRLHIEKADETRAELTVNAGD
ncbi:MAG: cyclic dehypoxanthinyl futalosine synthase [Phycisphaerales bacterium]|jgi:cyclic dehypoxanthinyl futalosine synthase